MMNRRDLLFAGGLSVLAGTRGSKPAAADGRPQQQSPQVARLLEALRTNRLPITMGDGPAGRGWDWLVEEAQNARFTLIGEEHGVAETARLSTALFTALRESGYSRLAIELSPIIAQDIEAAARTNGLDGVLNFFGLPSTWSPFYLREEAQLLAAAVNAVPRNEHVLWGLDRELFSAPYLISKLKVRVPLGARETLVHLQDLYSTAQDPAGVTALRAAWPNPDRESDTILRTLEESLAITAAARINGWAYSERRAQWNRNNLAERLRDERTRGASPKVMLKFGYNHMIRGANYVNTFDIGAMTDEVAALDGGRAFHVIVLPGPGSRQAVMGHGHSMVAVSSDEWDEFQAGEQRLTRVLPNANATEHEVINLRALRPLAMRGLESWNPDVIRTIHGFDAAVIWKGARASIAVE